MDFDNSYPAIAGTGLIGIFLIILVWVIGFVISAFVASLWIRLVLTFMRKRLDSEYALMRGQTLQPYRPIGSPPTGPGAPRNW